MNVILQIFGVFCFENDFSGQDGLREGKGGAHFFGRFSAQKIAGAGDRPEGARPKNFKI